MEQRITAPKGCKIESVEHDNNSVVIMFSEDKPKFKKGDFLKSTIGETIVIYKEQKVDKDTFESYFNNKHSCNYYWDYKLFDFCTDKEKQEMLDYMHSNGKDWDEDNMKVIPYVWKPQRGEKYWLIHTYFEVRFSFYDTNNGSCFNDIKYYNFFKTEGEAQKYAKELKRILKEREL